MSLPARSIVELSHPHGCWQPFFPQTSAAISSAGNGVAESDWFTPGRHIKIVEMILAVVFPTCLASYPPAALEAKFGKARLLLMVVSRAPIHMLPPLFHDDADPFY
jgi:hypothetical protein